MSSIFTPWRRAFALATLLCSVAASSDGFITRHPELFREVETLQEQQAPSPVTGTTETVPVTDVKSSSRYFAVGVGTFLVGFALFLRSIGKLNYLEEIPAGGLLLQQGNPQAEDEPVTHAPSTNPEHPGNRLLHRMQQVLVSWMFIIASISFFLDYLCLQSNFDAIRHWFGMAAAFLWLIGFLVHFHWQLETNVRKTLIFAAWFKVTACIMLQVHPLCMVMGMEETDPEVWWPAFGALALWHIGNIIACVDYTMRPPETADRNAGIFAYCNLFVTELWIDQMATWLLLIASFCTTQWNGEPENQLVDTYNPGVAFCQMGGALMFLLAASLRCEWCNGFKNCSHRGGNMQQA